MTPNNVMDTQRALAAAKAIIDGRDPSTDYASILVTAEHAFAVVLLACMGGDPRKAAWAGDILTLPENYGREADVKTVARFTDEIRSRLNLLDEWAGREKPEAADEIERLRSALGPLVPALTAILAETPRDSKGSDEFNLFTDCEGNEYCVTLDQIRAVVEIMRK